MQFHWCICIPAGSPPCSLISPVTCDWLRFSPAEQGGCVPAPGEMGAERSTRGPGGCPACSICRLFQHLCHCGRSHQNSVPPRAQESLLQTRASCMSSPLDTGNDFVASVMGPSGPLLREKASGAQHPLRPVTPGRHMTSQGPVSLVIKGDGQSFCRQSWEGSQRAPPRTTPATGHRGHHPVLP